MTKIIYPELSYTVQGVLYDVYNELRYFDLSEEGWENGSLPISTRQAWRLRRCGYDDMTANQRIDQILFDKSLDSLLYF